MKYVDPSGHGFFSKLWKGVKKIFKKVIKPIIAVAVAVVAAYLIGPAGQNPITKNVHILRKQLEVVRDKYKLSSFWSTSNQVRIGRYDTKFYIITMIKQEHIVTSIA